MNGSWDEDTFGAAACPFTAAAPSVPVAGVTVFGVTVFSTGATSLLVVVVVVQSGEQYCAAAALFPLLHDPDVLRLDLLLRGGVADAAERRDRDDDQARDCDSKPEAASGPLRRLAATDLGA